MGAGNLDNSYVRDLVEGIEARGMNVYPTSGFLKRLDFLKAISLIWLFMCRMVVLPR